MALLGLSCHLVSLQSVVTRVTVAHDRQRLWASNVASVVRLQVRLWGCLARQQLPARWHGLHGQGAAATRIRVTQPPSVPPLNTATPTKGGRSQGRAFAALYFYCWPPRAVQGLFLSQ